MDAIERLRFLIDFSRMDLAKMREGDRLNLREDLDVFVNGSPGGDTFRAAGGLVTATVAVKAPAPREYPDDKLSELQVDVLALLEGVAWEAMQPSAGAAGVRTRWLRQIPVTGLFSVCAPAGSQTTGPGHIMAQGETRDMVLLKAIALLTREDVGHIRSCPECKRVFWRVRRQLYCSRECVNRVNKRNWRAGAAKPRGRSKRRETKRQRRKNA